MTRRPSIPFLGKRRETHDHFTVLDIGTSMVKALIVKREGEQGIVIGCGKAAQKQNDMQAGAVANIQSVIDTCEAALSEAEDMCETIPSQVIVGIAGEQVYGALTTVAFPRQHPTARISQAELASAIQLLQRRSLRNAVKEMSTALGVDEINIKLVHSVITAIDIDGHQVHNPVDFQGQKITISVFNTFAPISHIGALQTIADELDLDLMATIAEPYALARACATEALLESGAIFIDVGGGTTDVALVSDRTISGMKMCALGGRSFTRRLMTDMSMTYDQAEQFKVAYSQSELPLEQRRHAHDLFLPPAEVLAHSVGLIIEELAPESDPPSHIALAGGGSILPDVLEQLKLLNWKDVMPSEYHPIITPLHPDSVQGMFDSTGTLVSAQDVTPLAIGYYAMTMHDPESAPLGALMQRVLQTMKV